MRVYKIRERSLRPYIARIAGDPESALTMRVLCRETRFRRQDLYSYRMKDAEIDAMVESGFLQEIEVGRSDALSIAGYHKMRTDNSYRDMVLENMRRARQVPVDPKRRREYSAKARKAIMRPIRSRRRQLLQKIILPAFGSQQDGGYIPPEEIAIVDVVEEVKNNPNLLAHYPEGLYAAVMLDIHRLGIQVTYKGTTISRSWQRILQDPEVAARVNERVARATEARLRLYEEDPTRAEKVYRKSAATRRRLMQEDTEFRRKTLENLAKGAPALWDKYRSDEDFRKRLRNKQIRNLAKGNRTQKRRATRRQRALQRVIEKRFGSLDNVIGPKLTRYLEERRPAFVRDYYAGHNLASLIKKDLRALRDNEEA